MKIYWIKVYNLLFKSIEKNALVTDQEFYSFLKDVDFTILEYEDFIASTGGITELIPKKKDYWNLIDKISDDQKFDFFNKIVSHLDKLNASNLDELKTLFNRSLLIKDIQKKTSFDFLQKAESTLYLVVLFLKSIMRTLYHFLFYPYRFANAIDVNETEDVSIDNNKYEQPLIYLFFFTLLCVLYGYAATSTKFASELLLEDAIFKPFVGVLEKVWQYVKELDWKGLLIIMVPLILFTILYAVSMTISCKILKMKPNFKLNLYLASYYFGTYLFLHGLLFSYAMISSSFKDSFSLDVLFSLILIWHVVIILLILKNFHSFYIVVKTKIGKRMTSTILFITIATILFILIFIPIGMLAFPFYMI